MDEDNTHKTSNTTNTQKILVDNQNTNLLNSTSVFTKNTIDMREPSNSISKFSETQAKKIIKRKIIGYVLLAFGICVNVLSSIWLQFIETDVKPFTLTYINYSFLSFLIIICFIRDKCKQCFIKEEKEHEISTMLDQTKDDTFSDTYDKIRVESKIKYEKEFHFICVILMFCWFFGNAFYNMGLTLTSITSANTLSNSAIIFILVEKVIFFKSKCSKYKIIGLLLCMGGVILMAYFEATIKREDEKERTIKGDICILLGAFCFSLYANLVKYFSKKHKHHFDMMRTFGFIGFYNMIIMPFLLLFLQICSIEKIRMPTFRNLCYILINAVVAGFISDLAQSYSMILLAPHIVSFALIFSAPLSYLYDYLIGDIKLNYFYLLGSGLIFSAFICIFYENILKIKRKSRIKYDRIRDDTNYSLHLSEENEIKPNP
jgi:drug/metabolite transporter (DMT)-like permease